MEFGMKNERRETEVRSNVLRLLNHETTEKSRASVGLFSKSASFLNSEKVLCT